MNNLKIFNNNIDVYFQIITEKLSKTNWISELWKYVKIQWWYSFKASEYKNIGIPIIRISDFNNWKIILEDVKYYEENSKFNDFLLNSWDIIIAMTGWTIWKLAIVQGNLWKLYLNQRVWRFQILEKDIIYNEYLYWIARWVENIVKNMWYWWAQPNVSWKQIESIKFVFPEIIIQKNIVNFLNDLKDWKLENKEYFNKDTEQLILNLHNKSLDIDLIWLKSQENFNYIKQLKQAILQEAIEWKLTKSWREKNTWIESASVLLEKIKKEKNELVKQKKLKKQEKLKEISQDEIPFEIPENSVICRLWDIVQVNPRNQLEDNLDVSFIPMKLINDWFINTHTSEKLKWIDIKGWFTHFQENDVVFAKITPCFQNRKSAVMKNLINWFWAWTTELIVLRSYNNLILPELLLYFVKSKWFIDLWVSTYTWTAWQQRVDREKLLNMPFLLPPLEEQKEIVKKVDELMIYCDLLEKQSLETKENSENLMKSVLNEVFSK